MQDGAKEPRGQGWLVTQLSEHFVRNEEVGGSNPPSSTRLRRICELPYRGSVDSKLINSASHESVSTQKPWRSLCNRLSNQSGNAKVVSLGAAGPCRCALTPAKPITYGSSFREVPF